MRPFARLRRRALRGLCVCLAVGCGALVTAQAPGGTHPPRHRPTDPGDRDYHRCTTYPTPREVMAWLVARTEAARTEAARTEGAALQRGRHEPDAETGTAAHGHATAGEHAPPSSEMRSAAPPTRPANAGRWVVAVVADAELDVDVDQIFGVARRDILVLASPGPCLRPEELALLEHAVATEHLALCVILVREGGTSSAAGHETPAARALRRRLQAPPEPAGRPPTSAAVVHAQRQAELATTASDLLAQAAKRGTFRAAVAVLPARAGAPRLVAPWFERPLADELVAEQAARLDAESGPSDRERGAPPTEHKAALRQPQRH